MSLDVSQAASDHVLPWRDLYRAEMNCQIIHDSWHGRGWADSFLLGLDGRDVGYGLVGGVRADPKDIVFEFYVLPAYRAAALPLFRRLAAVSRAKTVMAQTNDLLLTLMLYDCAREIVREAVLFHDALTTQLTVPAGTLRRATAVDADRVFDHKAEPVGDWVIDAEGTIVATGGLLFHYNVPYGDIFMEVAEPFRQRGYGSYLVQELKRVCYEMGRIPAARCNPANAASRATLQKAGMLPCARIVTGTLAAEAGDPSPASPPRA